MMKTGVSNFIFQKHPFFGPLVLILLCSVPWWIAFWPGTLQYDSGGQLLMYYGYVPLNDHHPIVSSLLMGWAMDVGLWLFHSGNAGIFLYTALQFLAQSAVIAYGFYVLYKTGGCPLGRRWGILFFYTLLPLFPCWGISLVKDSGYYISFLLFTLVLIDCLYGSRKDGILQKSLWIIAVLGILSFRKEGRWLLLLVSAVLVIRRKQWRRMVLQGLAACLLFLLAEGAFKTWNQVESGSVREMLSVPLMQTAVSIGKYQGEMTEEEKAAVLSVFQVESLDEVALQYHADISDPVKDLLKSYPGKRELYRYFQAWIKGFFRHPLLYVKTFWDHCDRYFKIWKGCYKDSYGWFTLVEGEAYSCDYFQVSFSGGMAKALRARLVQLSDTLYGLPIVRLLFRPALYTWIMLGCVTVVMRRGRWEGLYIFLPGILVLLICTISPLNGSVRYYLPVMAAAPFYIECAGRKDGGV